MLAGVIVDADDTSGPAEQWLGCQVERALTLVYVFIELICLAGPPAAQQLGNCKTLHLPEYRMLVHAPDAARMMLRLARQQAINRCISS
jgi:hypothetical protein